MIMPKMDGLGVLEKLKNDTSLKKMPAFIVLSAIGQEAVTEDAFALGANYYIMKPFNNEMLLGRLRASGTGEKRYWRRPGRLRRSGGVPVRSGIWRRMSPI